MGQNETFSIRQMIELTGLSEFTIRGWENRYSAFCPKRGQTGRRQYLRNDVEKALLLRELIKRGHRVGQVANLTNQRLRRLFEVSDKRQQDYYVEKNSRLVRQALELVALQDWNDLEKCIRNFKIKNVFQAIDEFFLPMLRTLAENVNAGLVSVSQEHVFSSLLKEKIFSALGALNTQEKTNNRARFVLAAPEGDYHEMGLLLGHLLIRSFGFRSVYLGGHTPARDLSETILRFNATHALIVATISKKDGAFKDPLTYINEVQKKVGARVQILFAGSQAPVSQEFNSSLTIVGDFRVLKTLLESASLKFQKRSKSENH